MSRILMTVVKVLLLIILMMSLVACKPWTIVKNTNEDDDESIKIYFASDDFDVDAYTRDIWENKLITYYDDKKIEAATLLEALLSDENAAGEKYGIGSNDTGSSWTFIIEGKGQVIEVDQESRAGVMLVDLQPYDGESDITIQIGPVIKGTTVRDTLDFIKLDDFSNQVQFASISKAFNALVVSEVVTDIDFKTLEGEEISFLGCFTHNSDDQVLATPIKMAIGEGQ